eukprot:TRINITY_DN78248_c0_g1_i1.p1 TRINITY_DN78248_c0_g1~~TRINITY_DN78248_c0_g1_i1.p1  ORF type:complete len:543 (+),score=71.63 TRINITY_DN78248_c0_g1_i1:46-1674(+)
MRPLGNERRIFTPYLAPGPALAAERSASAPCFAPRPTHSTSQPSQQTPTASPRTGITGLMHVKSAMDPGDVVALKRLFKRYDADCDGRITAMELREFLRSTGLYENEEALYDMIKQGDANGNGCLEEAEFVSLISQRKHLARLMSLTDGEIADLKEAFYHFDKDANGRIDFGEFQDALHKARAELSQDQVEELFQEGDLDSDGSMTLPEFLALLSHQKRLNKIVLHGRYCGLNGIRKCCEVLTQPAAACIAFVLRSLCCASNFVTCADLPDEFELGTRDSALRSLGACARLVGGLGYIDEEYWGKFDPPLNGHGWRVVEQVCETKGSKWEIQAGCYFCDTKNPISGHHPNAAIVAFRGTCSLQGLWQDASTLVPHEGSAVCRACLEAKNFVSICQQKYPDKTFFVTGHSLGGYLAEVVASRLDVSGASFNNPGPWAVCLNNTGNCRPCFEVHLTRDDPVAVLFPRPAYSAHISKPKWHHGSEHRYCEPYVPDRDALKKVKPNDLHFDEGEQVRQWEDLDDFHSSDESSFERDPVVNGYTCLG